MIRRRVIWTVVVATVVLLNIGAMVALGFSETVVLEEPSNSAEPSFYRGFVEPVRQRVRVPNLGADQLGLFLKVDGLAEEHSTVILRARNVETNHLLFESSQTVIGGHDPGLISFDIPMHTRASERVIDLEVLPVSAPGSFLGIGMSTGDRYAFSRPFVASAGQDQKESHHDVTFRFGRRVVGDALLGKAARDGGVGLAAVAIAVAVICSAVVFGGDGSVRRPRHFRGVHLAGGLLLIGSAVSAIYVGAAHFYASAPGPVAFGLEYPRIGWIVNFGFLLVACTGAGLVATTVLNFSKSGKHKEPARVLNRAVTVVGLTIPFASLVWMGWQRRWIAEDAFIHFRVVRNLVAGDGPVFNLGERVEASTSPAWVGLLASLHRAVSWLDIEWIAVSVGLMASVVGVFLVGRAGCHVAERSHEHVPGRGGILPVGAVALCSIPAFWDFATSGLETGLVFGWLGSCIYGLVCVGRVRASCDLSGSSKTVVPPAWLVVLIGVGPLIRPDLAVFSIGFLAGAVLLSVPLGWRSMVRIFVYAGALPVAYQVFRMGYYGSLVPNTAIAKEAGAVVWDRGVSYVGDFVSTYFLWVPLTIVVWLGGMVVWRKLWGRGERRLTLLMVMNVAAALIYGIWVVRFGGDFMHARMLLPVAFVLLGPLSAVIPFDGGWRRIRQTWVSVVPTATILLWAVICALWLRWESSVPGVIDERAFNVARSSGRLNPVTLSDYSDWFWAQDARRLNSLVDTEPGLVVLEGDLWDSRAWLDAKIAFSDRVVSVHQAIGMIGFGSRNDVWIVDSLGLADPLAARVKREVVGLPAHEKRLPQAWIVARFVAEDSIGMQSSIGEAEIRSARHVLSCGDVARLIEATSATMSFERFVSNLLDSVRLSGLRISADPIVAGSVLCEP